MGNLQEKLTSAIMRRESNRHEEARRLLLELHSECPEDPQVNYQCSWIHDQFGLERDAIPFYEKAVQTGLRRDGLKSALPGMGSTCRCAGDYQKSTATLQHALTLFPDSLEFKVLLGMPYYNTGEHSKAMEFLLNTLADTSSDGGMLRYRRAIRFYLDKLNQIW